MEQTIHTITIDLQRPGNPGAVTVKKGDTHRLLRLRLLSGGKPYVLSEDCYAVFTAQKPDGTVIYNACTREGNTLLYQLTPQTTAVAGTLDCEIKLYGENDALLTTAAFCLTVEETVYTQGDEAVTSTGEATALTQLITQAQAGITQARAVAEELLQAKEDGLFNGPQGEKGEKGDAEGAVLYLEQALTADQKAQARENIGAVSETECGIVEVCEELALDIETGSYYTTTQTKVSTAYGACTGIIPVKCGEKLLITSSYGWASTLIVEHDAANTPIGHVGESVNNRVVVTDFEYTVPEGVWGITVSTQLYSTYPISVKKAWRGIPGVLYSAQKLTDLQKAQARENVGAAEKAVETQLADLLMRMETLEDMLGVGKEITFTVFEEDTNRETTHAAKQGMTWREWVASAYNPDYDCSVCLETKNEFQVAQDGRIRVAVEGICVDCDSGTHLKNADQTAFIQAEDVIASGYTYQVVYGD